MKVKERPHWVLVVQAVSLIAWSVMAYVAYNASSEALLRVVLPISCVPMFFFFPLQIHFGWVLFRREPAPAWLMLLIYTPGAALAVINFFVPVAVEVITGAEGALMLRGATGTPVNTAWAVYASVCWLAPLGLYIRYYRSARLNRERKQGAFLIFWIIGTILIVIGEYFASSGIESWTLPPLSPVILSIWIAVLVYAIWKYGFLKLSPHLLAEEILDSIEDLVLLYGIDGARVYANRKALTVLDPGRSVVVRSPDPLSPRVTPYLDEVPTWKPGEPEKQFRVRIPSVHPQEDSRGVPAHDETASGEPDGNGDGASGVLLHTRAKPVFDRFNDPLGLLVSASVVPRFQDRLQAYDLTDREAEIIEYLVSGWTVARTAAALQIAERTVKSHITHIYAKLGVRNRVELTNMLGSSGSREDL